MRPKTMGAVLLMLALTVTPASAAHTLTAAWAPPFGYAVVSRGLAPEGACVVRVEPLTVLGCGAETTYIIRPEDGAQGGDVFELRDGAMVLATATLGGRVALPQVAAP